VTARIWGVLVGMFLLTAFLLFASAGTLYWPDGWWFLVLYIVAGLAVTLWLARNDPALLAARMNIRKQEGQPAWDRLVVHSAQFIWWGWLILMGLDGGRFGWSHLPDWLIWVGRAGMLVGIWGIYRTFRENSFGAPVVRIQAERGHKVISTGPYAIVRHPMYASAGIMLVSMALALNSAWGVLAALLIEYALTLRIKGEEQVLRDGLPGYLAYTKTVRYRLIPFIW
jgi:protein-S-isoprenylcysteine O-methyltransferase Ste14